MRVPTCVLSRCMMGKAGATLLAILAVLLAVLPGLAQNPKPVWHTQFSVHFTETTKILWTRKTSGVWWYDAVQQAEVIDREDGSGDRYCGSIHPFTHTPCRHLITQGGHYLIFPERSECCMCCTWEHGCGPLRPDWLDTADFQGQEEMQGLQVYKWVAKGLQPNIYYSTADEEQRPVELDQVPNDLQSFQVDTFRKRPIPAKLLQVPDGCQSSCPLTSICTLLRLKAARLGRSDGPTASE